ncbi:hypothetical protein ACWD04_03370 [Streptomyces sp. NPDC002911]
MQGGITPLSALVLVEKLRAVARAPTRRSVRPIVGHFGSDRFLAATLSAFTDDLAAHLPTPEPRSWAPPLRCTCANGPSVPYGTAAPVLRLEQAPAGRPSLPSARLVPLGTGHG